MSDFLSLGGLPLFANGLVVLATMLWRDGTVIGGATLLLLALIGWDLRLDHHDGLLLFVLLGAYLWYLFKQRRADVDDSFNLWEMMTGERAHCCGIAHCSCLA